MVNNIILWFFFYFLDKITFFLFEFFFGFHVLNIFEMRNEFHYFNPLDI